MDQESQAFLTLSCSVSVDKARKHSFLTRDNTSQGKKAKTLSNLFNQGERPTLRRNSISNRRIEPQDNKHWLWKDGWTQMDNKSFTLMINRFSLNFTSTFCSAEELELMLRITQFGKETWTVFYLSLLWNWRNILKN